MPWTASFDQLTHDFSALPFSYPALTQIVKITPAISGESCRLHLNNRYNQSPLIFDSISIGRTANEESAGFHFHGATTIVIPAGGEINTDPLPFPLAIEQPVYITMRTSHPQKYADFASSYHPGWVNAILAQSAHAHPRFSNNWHQRKGWFCLERLDVLRPQPVIDVEITGDSLVETGMLTTPLLHYACRQFPNQISWHLTGILGNQLLHDGPDDEPLYQTFGPALLKRQLLKDPCPLTVALIGSNDLVVPSYSQVENLPSAQQLQQGFTHLADHSRRLIVTTLPPLNPLGLNPADLNQIQATRNKVNAWLKLQPWAVDPNPGMTDPANGQLKVGLGFGDGLHWSPRGGRYAAKILFPKIAEQIRQIK